MRLQKMEKIGLKDQDGDKCMREYQSKEEQFRRQLKDLKEHCSDLEMIEKAVQKEIKREEREFVQRCRELKLMEDSVTMKFEELKEKEEQFRLKMNQFWRFFTTQERKLEMGFQEKEKHEDLEQRYRELEFKEKHYAECLRKVELREKELVERSNYLESKSLALALRHQGNNESAGSSPFKCSIDHSSPAHLRFCVYMDGKDLQMFLNERWKEHGSIGTEVAMVLPLAADPAKLVLDAMEGFYPPHLSKGDREFDVNVARSSCIILLEQLMKLSPEVKPHVKKEAMKLSFSWMTKMRAESGHELEVLGFLLLLASFQLAGAFDTDELVNFLEFVAQHIQTPELFKVLGLGDKITGFIRKLIEKKQHLEAIRYIYAFEQVNEFPPVPLLKDFLSHSDAEATKVMKKGKMAPKAQKEQNTKRIADLKAIVKCIEDKKLESEYQPQNLTSLKNLILSLEKVDGSRSLIYPKANRTLCTAPVGETSSQKQVGIKRPRDFVTTGNAPLGATMIVSSNNVS
ncbi:hypothetical protein V6N13_148165 [Hibiscus sabdariffa]|uniref:FRIGIDA-like protein n=1 Tax=Hibiscus sabdariffa TaxID=183260 RepID=A0ABR2TYG5_9ROSI